MRWNDADGAKLDAAGRWSPGIGDPSLMGWVTVAVYLLAAVLCARTARAAWREAPAAPSQAGPSARDAWRLWGALAALLLALGLNKQLDLQSLFTQTGRDLALAQGWYAQRRWVQGGFIALLGAAALGVAWWLRHTLREPAQRLAGLGLCFLMAFVVMRAASFHHMDGLINASFAGIRMNWVLELAGLGVILLATRRAARASAATPGNAGPRVPPPPPPRHGLRPGPAPGASVGDAEDPPLIAWLRLRLAPLRSPIERHLRRRAEAARRLAREAAGEGAREEVRRKARAAANTAPASGSARPNPRGEVTRVRRR